MPSSVTVLIVFPYVNIDPVSSPSDSSILPDEGHFSPPEKQTFQKTTN